MHKGGQHCEDCLPVTQVWGHHGSHACCLQHYLCFEQVTFLCSADTPQNEHLNALCSPTQASAWPLILSSHLYTHTHRFRNDFNLVKRMEQKNNSLLPYPSLIHSGTESGEVEPSGDRDGVTSELSNSWTLKHNTITTPITPLASQSWRQLREPIAYVAPTPNTDICLGHFLQATNNKQRKCEHFQSFWIHLARKVLKHFFKWQMLLSGIRAGR